MISADGSYVAFTSMSPIGLVDLNSHADVYLFERATGIVSLVSRKPDGMAGSGRSFMPRIDAAGRYVVFLSEANDLVPGQVDSGAKAQVFLFDRLSGTTTLVSRAAGTAATESNGYASGADISAAGHRIVFGSEARDLLAGQVDTFGAYDVFLYDTISGTTTLVSRIADGSGIPAGGTVGRARISGDGGSVIFGSFAPNLVSGQSESEFTADLFLYDVSSGGMTLVSHAYGAPTTATEAEFWPGNMAVSDEGAYVMFMSTSPDLLPGANSSQRGGVWIFERETGLISLASRTMFGIAGRSGTLQADISADGNYVAFDCDDADVVPSDLNGTTDVFLFGPVWSPDHIFADGFEPS